MPIRCHTVIMGKEKSKEEQTRKDLNVAAADIVKAATHEGKEIKPKDEQADKNQSSQRK